MSGATPPLDPAAAFSRAVVSLGSQTAMARLLGLTQGAISKRLRKQQPLPAEHVVVVEAATGISRHELRPDIYPREPAPAPPVTDRFEAAR